MVTIKGIKALAREVWPYAANFDVYRGAAGPVSLTGPNPQGFRLVACDANQRITELLTAPTLDELKAKIELSEKGKTND